MESEITATAAARAFSDVVNRVRYRGEEFVVTRAGTAVCRILPVAASRATVADLVRVLRAAPRPDEEFLDVVDRLSKHQPRVPGGPWRP